MARLALVGLAALALVGCGGGGEEAASPAAAEPAPGLAAGVADNPAALVYAWYAESDPNVCDHMTDSMLDFGWGLEGDEGRAECRASVGESQAYASVEVAEPALSGDTAEVKVTYAGGEGDPAGADVVTFVRIGDAWLIDAVRVAD